MKVLEIVFTEKEKKIYKFFLDNTEEEIKEKIEEIKKANDDPDEEMDLKGLIDWFISDLNEYDSDIDYENKLEGVIESTTIRDAEEWEL